jgi:hypothetical protein
MSTCVVRLTIDTGASRKAYDVRPMAPVAAPFVCGFRLVNLTDEPRPTYFVRLPLDGKAVCNCRSWQATSSCKHCNALAAAGFFPDQLLLLLQQAQAELQRITDAATTEQMVYQHDSREAQDKIADLEWSLKAVTERACQLQTGLDAVRPSLPSPRSPRGRRKRVAA